MVRLSVVTVSVLVVKFAAYLLVLVHRSTCGGSGVGVGVGAWFVAHTWKVRSRL